MKLINWNRDKNEWLRENRNICFDDILFYIEKKLILDDIAHPNQDKYLGQRMMVFNIKEYIYLVPYIETEDEIFLKTIIPCRKATKKYLRKKDE
ncbi:MAG: hypothetical protein L3J41_02350 [Melioribacteraceae bacterium]|nr:hypothetical protein [Melioribacteraceae bacterium]